LCSEDLLEVRVLPVVSLSKAQGRAALSMDDGIRVEV
jgi:hypothetical protein